MKKSVWTWILCAALVLCVAVWFITAPAEAAVELTPYVTTGETTADAVMQAWATGQYSHVQLGADLALTVESSDNLIVDLAGHDLTVSGSGKVSAFDTANDTFDHTVCGTLTCESGVTCKPTFTAPTDNGYFYIAYGSNGRYTFHRMDMTITNVVFRPTSAGVYYKAYFACDRLIEESVLYYGVVARGDGTVPGKNFKTGGAYTQNTGLISGTTVNSGIIENILQESATADANKENANTAINARLYIELEGQGIVMAPKYATATFNSLLKKLNDQYSKLKVADQNQMDAFSAKWKTNVTDWNFANLGKNAALDFDAMNAPLEFEEGTTKAKCHRCGESVTWTALSDETKFAATDGGHYYLAENLEYTLTESEAFISTGEKGTVSCLHLNGHDITSTKISAFWVGSGKMYVMGQGTVTGKSSKADTGAAVHGNNRNANNGIYLYGGIYKKTSDSISSAPVIGMGPSARNYNIYENVTVDGGIYFDGTSSTRNNEGYLNLLGCTVNGNIKMIDLGTWANNVSIVDATINGTLNVPVGHNVYLQGAPKIQNLSVATGAKVITKGLQDGADIKVTATGYFTDAYSNLADYTDYFSAKDQKQGVFMRDGALYCGKDYVSDLNFANADGDDTTADAYCPVCEKNVVWTALDQAFLDANVNATANTGYSLPGDSHFYLTENVTGTSANKYTLLGVPSSNGKSCCIHLNGHDLTATKTTVFYSSDGILNIMGDGTVAGTAHGSYGASVHSNNRDLESSMNFYSGTYTSTNGSGYVIRIAGNGGRLYFYDDAVIEQGNATRAIHVDAITGRDSSVTLTGTTVNGDVTVNGISDENTFGASITLTLNGAKVKGTVTANKNNNLVMLNDVQIGLLDASEDSKAILQGSENDLTIGDGARVTVQNAGAFAFEFDGAADYVSCFRAAWRDDKIVSRDNVLTYKPNYEMGLQLDGSSVARCPVCQEYVTWTAVTDEAASVKFTEGGHYYLPKDLTFDADSASGAYLISGGTGTTTCLHLNGHTVTSRQESAIAVSNGVINVMGEGTVQGGTENTNGGCAVLANNSTATNGANLYSGTYKKLDANSNKPVISVKERGGNITVYEDAIVNAEGGVAVYTGTAEEGTGRLTLDNVAITGDVVISGAVTPETYQSVFNSYHSTVNGNVNVAGTNDITFFGETNITGKLTVAEGCLVNFADMLQPDSSIVVDATGTFTNVLAKPRAWVTFFAPENKTEDWVVAKDGALYLGKKMDLSTEAVADTADKTALDASYADLVVKYGEMHNHTSAGLTADGRRTLAQWKDRMVQLNMSFATIVDHKQVAHMYHKDWQTEPTEDYPVVFVGGSEPQTGVTELNKATQGNMHYNMITGDPEKLVELVKQMENLTGKNFYSEGAPYSEANWGANGTNNKNKDFVWSDYNEPDGMLDRIFYADWTKTEFDTMVKNFYDTGSLIVEVHPDYPSYIKSEDPLDYCFAGDAGSATSAAMGFEIHTGNYGYMPSRTYNEKAYQLWLDMLEAGKKVYATYGDDGHRLPTAVALTTAYAPDDANAAYYMQLMHDGNFAPGWVGIRMIVGDTQMGGTADSFDGQRLVFSIGDMYQANDYSRLYLDKSQKVQTMDWEPGYDPTCTYTVRLYDDSGLLQESVVNPGDDEMDYFAIDADPTAKFYRVEVWVENADGSVRYRCGVGNPIWNAAAYATAE